LTPAMLNVVTVATPAMLSKRSRSWPRNCTQVTTGP
jgi:hypothetical protein